MLPFGEVVWRKGSARAGLYLLIADVTVSSHSGHPTRGCIPNLLLADEELELSGARE